MEGEHRHPPLQVEEEVVVEVGRHCPLGKEGEEGEEALLRLLNLRMEEAGEEHYRFHHHSF